MPNVYVRRGPHGEARRKPDRDRRTRVRVAAWIDPFPWIQGSTIEKMVMAEFVRRGIYFQHTPQTNSLVWIPGSKEMLGSDPRKMEGDFLLPQYHIWIEIQGSYWHTLPGMVEKDALRFALIEAAGWKPIFWWEEDIRARLMELMDAVPEFYRVKAKLQKGWKTTDGLSFYEGGDGVDHLAGMRAALSARARPPQRIKVKRRSKRRPKYGSS